MAPVAAPGIEQHFGQRLVQLGLQLILLRLLHVGVGGLGEVVGEKSYRRDRGNSSLRTFNYITILFLRERTSEAGSTVIRAFDVGLNSSSSYVSFISFSQPHIIFQSLEAFPQLG